MYFYLKCLAVFDLIFCLAMIPGVMMLRWEYTTWYIFIVLIGRVFRIVWHVSPSISIIITTIISLDRLFHVRAPIRARRIVNMHRARLLIVAVFLFCAIFRLPFAVMITIETLEIAPNQTIYWNNWSTALAWPRFSRISLIVMAVIFDYIPPIVITIRVHYNMGIS